MLRWSWIKFKSFLIFRICWIKTHNSFWEHQSFINSEPHTLKKGHADWKLWITGSWKQGLLELDYRFSLKQVHVQPPPQINLSPPSFFFPSTLPPRLHLLHWICCYSLPSNVGPTNWADFTKHKDDSPLVAGNKAGKLKTQVTSQGMAFFSPIYVLLCGSNAIIRLLWWRELLVFFFWLHRGEELI